MNEKSIATITLALSLLGLLGCSRTVEDVSKWESSGKTEKLKSALADPKVEVRKAAADSLGSLKAESAVDALAACLNDSEESVQLAAIDALSSIGTKDTITPLIAAFKLDNQNARLKAAKALGTLKAEASVDPLVEALDDPDEAIRLAACKALAHIGGPVALKALVDKVADQDDRIRDEAINGLMLIGDPAVPAMIEGLKSGNPEIRTTSLKLIRGLGAIPPQGPGLVWYQLARASLTEDSKIKADAIDTLANEGASAVSTLIEAASLKVPEIREPAAEALEWIGEPALAKTMAATDQVVLFERKEWLKGRAEWTGAPSPLLDLYAAVSVLNPDFPAAQDAQTILNSPEAAKERAYIPVLIGLLANDSSRSQAVSQLKSAGLRASLPLIAAFTSTNTPVAEAAAEIMVDRSDTRAFEPLMTAIQHRLDAGDALSKSWLYTTLVKLDNAGAEPLLMKIRPNTDRALQVFGRQYRTAKAVGAETSDPYTDNEAPVTIRIGYIENGKPGTLEITFKKDQRGNWNPSPALPYSLQPSSKTQMQNPPQKKQQTPKPSASAEQKRPKEKARASLFGI